MTSATVEQEFAPRFRAGIVAAVALAVVLAAGAASLAIPNGSTYTAVFARADGAKVGNEVRVAGVSVGEVTKVELAQDRIIVTFDVDPNVRLGNRTRAAMKLSTLLGAYYMEVTPDGTETLPNRRVPITQTTVPYTLDSVVNAAGTVTQKLDGAKVRGALTAFSEAIGENGDSADEAFDAATRLADTIVERRGQLEEFLKAVRSVTAIARENRTDLVDLVQDSATVFAELRRRREAIVSLLERTSAVSAQINTFMSRNDKEFSTALANLNDVIAILRQTRKEIDRSLQTLAPSLRGLTTVLGDGPYASVRVASILPDNYLCATGQVQPCH